MKHKFSFKELPISRIIFFIICIVVLLSWVNYGTLIPPQIGDFFYNIRGNTVEVTWNQIAASSPILSRTSCSTIDKNYDVGSDFIRQECTQACGSVSRDYKCLDYKSTGKEFSEDYINSLRQKDTLTREELEILSRESENSKVDKVLCICS